MYDNLKSGINTIQMKQTSNSSTIQFVNEQYAFAKTKSDSYGSGTVQKKSNDTGLPDNLKYNIESLSGYSMNDVKVHYNSPKPAQMKALAYTQGTDIHVSPGQEKHLGHEAWHVVQQKQGRVQPITQMKGLNINDNASLEHEADIMGAKATQLKAANNAATVQRFAVMKNDIAQMKTNSNIVQKVKDTENFGFFSRHKRIISRALFKKHPKYTYRIEDRSPQQIKDANGFSPRNEHSNSTLLEHVNGQDLNNSNHNTRRVDGALNTNYVSTASAKAFIYTGEFGGLMTGDRYIYKISTEDGNFIDVLDYLDKDGSNDALRARRNYKSQREWASKGVNK